MIKTKKGEKIAFLSFKLINEYRLWQGNGIRHIVDGNCCK